MDKIVVPQLGLQRSQSTYYSVSQPTDMIMPPREPQLGHSFIFPSGRILPTIVSLSDTSDATQIFTEQSNLTPLDSKGRKHRREKCLMHSRIKMEEIRGHELAGQRHHLGRSLSKAVFHSFLSQKSWSSSHHQALVITKVV